jgi:hypothetical protein
MNINAAAPQKILQKKIFSLKSVFRYGIILNNGEFCRFATIERNIIEGIHKCVSDPSL